MITKEEFTEVMRDWNFSYSWNFSSIPTISQFTGEEVVNFLEKNGYSTHVFLAKVQTVSRTYDPGGGTESESYGTGFAKKMIAVKNGEQFPETGTEYPSLIDTFYKVMKEKLLNL